MAILGAQPPALPRILKCAEDQQEARISPEMARASAGLREEKGSELYVLRHVHSHHPFTPGMAQALQHRQVRARPHTRRWPP